MTVSRKTGCCCLILMLVSFMHDAQAGFDFCNICPAFFKCHRSNLLCDFYYKLCIRECPETPTTTQTTEMPSPTPTAIAPPSTSTEMPSPTPTTTAPTSTSTEMPSPTPTTPAPTRCGISSVTGPASKFITARTIGGTPAAKCEFPWMVFVHIPGHRCGGTILDTSHVITATHCLRPIGTVANLESVRVGYGSNDIQELTFLNVTNISDHSEFSSVGYRNDITILTLSGLIPYSSCVRPVCLPPANQTFEPLQDCIIVGWGYTDEIIRKSPQILRKVTVSIVTTQECQQIYGESSITQGQICAGKDGKDACSGDSGGPMICPRGDQWILAGIVSAGRGCGRVGYPGIYTYVPHFISWIKERL